MPGFNFIDCFIIITYNHTHVLSFVASVIKHVL